MSLVALQQLNIELTSRCSKKTICSMCAHQDLRTNPALKLGDMNFDLLRLISTQIESPTIISLHRDGDSVDFERLREALELFNGFPVSLVTHGERLAEKADDIIGRATTVTVSIVPKDPDRQIQLDSVREFMRKKGDRAPMLQLKFLGHINDAEEYEALSLPIINRALHVKPGNWLYSRATPPVPEVRVCLDFLSRPSIDWQGNVWICNRFNASKEGLIGDLNEQSLDEIWNGPVRQAMLQAHLAGRRDLANNLCKACTFWGIPTPAG